MALPNSGVMTAAMINTELGRSTNAAFSIGGTAERALAQKPSGAISFSDFYGKSSGPPTLPYTFAWPNIRGVTSGRPGGGHFDRYSFTLYVNGPNWTLNGVADNIGDSAFKNFSDSGSYIVGSGWESDYMSGGGYLSGVISSLNGLMFEGTHVSYATGRSFTSFITRGGYDFGSTFTIIGIN